MKCENCGSELVGGAIVCRQCNHNNAQGRVSQWRARRTGELQQPSTRTISPLSDAAKSVNSANSGSLKQSQPESRPLEPRRSNSIPFEPRIQINQTSTSPKGSSGSLSSRSGASVTEAASDADQQPAWREQLKERVKQSRERKVAGPNAGGAEADEAELDPNPIVEAALKRIRWSAHASPATAMPRVARHGAQAAALANEPEFEIKPATPVESKSPALSALPPLPPRNAEPSDESKTDPKPVARVAPTTTNPLLARRPTTQPVHPPETKSLPQQQTARPPAPTKPEPKPPVTTTAESRVETRHSAWPETKPVIENKISEPKTRVTGELKPPAPPPPPVTKRPQAKAQPETSVPAPPSVSARKPVETKVIGLPQPATAGVAAKQKSAAKDQPVNTWVRILAAACDFEIVATAYLPLFASYATLNTSYGLESLSILFVLLATLTFCYQLLTLVLADRTSGMALLNLRLVNLAGRDKPILFTQKFSRAMVATAAFLCPPLHLITNQKGHTLPDMSSGTTLVEK